MKGISPMCCHPALSSLRRPAPASMNNVGKRESWICRKTVARTAGSLLSSRAMFASGPGAPLSATQ